MMLKEMRRKIEERDRLFEGIAFDGCIKENKYSSIKIRCTYEEKEMIKTLAKLNRQTMSEFIRQLVLTAYLNEFLK